jgi:FkbM family methyltransferase
MEHVALNNLSDRIMPLCVGLSDETKMNILHMAQYDPGSAGNSLGGAPTYSGDLIKPTFKQPVPSFTGDEAVRILNLKKPDHVKLDVDGIEGAILRGMPDALLNARTVIVEVEGKNLAEAETRIDQPLIAAGFKEELSFRDMGSKRNRLFLRA